jgi:beta-phosphoglucomutase-like phosphatase (HAD superfamily)
MPLSGRYRAVIFDMDGLLLDTETLWHAAEIDLFRRHGGEFTWDDKMAVIGTSYDFTADYFADRLGRPRSDGPALVEEMVAGMHERVLHAVEA